MTSSLSGLPDHTPVLIVGGGPVGLVTAALLSRHRVPSVVVERRTEPQRAPAAHVIRPRSVDVLRHIGVEGEIRQRMPALDMHYITWCTTLGGAEIGRLDLRVSLDDPTEPVWMNCPQNILEPVLLDHVAHAPNATLVTGVTCADATDHGDRASVRVEAADGAHRHVEADWVIAADGAGSRTREHLGIEMIGQGALGRFFMIHFRADLAPWVEPRPGPIFWIMNPEATGTLIVHDVRESHVFMSPVTGAPDEEEKLPERLRAALGLDVPCEILSTAQWSPHVQVAERYREGRFLLAGDAAHRFPPSGGLGLNTGVLEARNLTWKLALVHHGLAPTTLLDSYETECRRPAETNAEESWQNLIRLGEVNQVVGTHPDLASMETRIATLDSSERAALDRAVEAQRSHFLSQGRFPTSSTGGPRDVAGYWPDLRSEFTLFATPGVDWSETAREATRLTRLPIAVETRLEGSRTLPDAFVVRPDGIPVWSSTSGTDCLAPAIRAAVGGGAVGEA